MYSQSTSLKLLSKISTEATIINIRHQWKEKRNKRCRNNPNRTMSKKKNKTVEGQEIAHSVKRLIPKHEDLSVSPRTHITGLSVVAHTCNPSAGGKGMGGSLGLPGHSV